MIQNFEKLDAELLEKFKSKSGVKIRGLVSTFDIKLVSPVLKNEFFSHLEVKNVLKIHVKILPLNIF